MFVSYAKAKIENPDPILLLRQKRHVSFQNAQPLFRVENFCGSVVTNRLALQNIQHFLPKPKIRSQVYFLAISSKVRSKLLPRPGARLCLTQHQILFTTLSVSSWRQLRAYALCKHYHINGCQTSQNDRVCISNTLLSLLTNPTNQPTTRARLTPSSHVHTKREGWKANLSTCLHCLYLKGGVRWEKLH